MKDHPISIRLDKKLRRALEALAAQDSRTLSDYIRVTLFRHVEGKGKVFRKVGH